MKLAQRKTTNPDHESITLPELMKKVGAQLEALQNKEKELDVELGIREVESKNYQLEAAFENDKSHTKELSKND